MDINQIALELYRRGIRSLDIDKDKFTDEVIWILSEKCDFFNKLYDELVIYETAFKNEPLYDDEKDY